MRSRWHGVKITCKKYSTFENLDSWVYSGSDRRMKVLEFGILSTERGRNNPIHRVLSGHAPRPRFEVAVHNSSRSHVRGWWYRDLRENSAGFDVFLLHIVIEVQFLKIRIRMQPHQRAFNIPSRVNNQSSRRPRSGQQPRQIPSSHNHTAGS
jgi:hypothetical protein